jgi:uncharacterized membrane protein YhaH (DUF805 family)
MFDFLFNPQGRISRKGMWLGFILPYLAISIVLGMLSEAAAIFAIISTIVGLFYLWPSLVAVPVKRLHDLGRSGWWLLLIYAVELVLAVLFVVGCFTAAEGTGLLVAFEDGSFERLSEQEQSEVFGELVLNGFSNGMVIATSVLLVLIGIATFVIFYVLPGQRADNRFGRDPLAEGRGFAD